MTSIVLLDGAELRAILLCPAWIGSRLICH